MDSLNPVEKTETSENANVANSDYFGPQGQVLIILVGLIGSGKVRRGPPHPYLALKCF